MGRINVLLVDVDMSCMDFWSASLKFLGVGVTAFIANFSRLSWDAKSRERIAQDLKILAALRPSPASEKLRQHIDEAVFDLIEERNRKEREKLWNVSAGFWLLAVALLIVIGFVPKKEPWDLLQGFLISAFVIAALMAISCQIWIFIRFVRENRTLKCMLRKMRGYFRRARSSEIDESDDDEAGVRSQQGL